MTAALELARAGRKVTVLESDPEYVGGLARTVRYDGNAIDIGGHRYYTKIDEIWDWWREVLPDDFIEVERQSRIYYKERFIRYPLEAWDALPKMGVLYAIQALFDHLYRKAVPLQPEVSFRDWVVNRFGDKLFNSFFESYTEKVWGMKCDEISADWAAQRIQGLSVWKIIARALTPSGLRKNEDASLKTLTDRFHYPRLGCGMLWERVAELVQAEGGVIFGGQTVYRIETEGSRVTGVVSRDPEGRSHFHSCGQIISSMPLRDLIHAFEPAPPAEVLQAAGGLRYRDFITVGLEVMRPNVFTDQWIYIHDPGVQVGRIQNYKNWSPAMVPDSKMTLLGMEYFCFEGQGLWSMSDEALIELARTEVKKIGLAESAEIEGGVVVRVPKAYPIYDDGYQNAVAQVRRWLQEVENIWSVGRNGTHRYNNQDHSMMTALLVARNLTHEEQHCPWMVNQNAEYLEERAVPGRLQEAIREA